MFESKKATWSSATVRPWSHNVTQLTRNKFEYCGMKGENALKKYGRKDKWDLISSEPLSCQPQWVASNMLWVYVFPRNVLASVE